MQLFHTAKISVRLYCKALNLNLLLNFSKEKQQRKKKTHQQQQQKKMSLSGRFMLGFGF